MDPRLEHELMLTRRHFFGRSAAGLGTIALASLCNRGLEAGDVNTGGLQSGAGTSGFPNFAHGPNG